MHFLKFFKIIIQIYFACLLGTAFSLIILQEDSWFKNFLEQKISIVLTDIIQERCNIKIKKVNLFTAQIIFDAINIKDRNKKWSLACSNFILNFSWFSILFKSKFDASLLFFDFVATSELNKTKLAITEPIIKLINAPSAIPFELKHLSLYNSRLIISQAVTQIKADILFSSEFTARDNYLNLRLSCHSGKISYLENLYAENISGAITVNSPLSDFKLLDASVHFSVDLSCINLPDRKCIIFGNYKNKAGTFQVKTLSRFLNAKIFSLEHNNRYKINIQANTKLAKLVNKTVKGDISLNTNLNINQNLIKCNSTCTINNFLYKNFAIDKLALVFQANNSKAYGSLTVENSKQLNLSGIWNFDFSSLEFKSSLIATDNFKIGSYKIKSGTSAQVELKNNCINFNLKNSSGILLNIKYFLANKIFKALINYKLIRDIINQTKQLDFPGSGLVKIQAKLKNKKLLGKILLDKADIRVPYMYNLIKKARALFELDLNYNCLLVKNLQINLHKGKIKSQYLTLRFLSSEIIYAHMPIICSNCFVSWQKELFGLVSGAFIFTYNKYYNSFLSGQLTVDKSHLRSNLLSPKLQKDLVNSTILNKNIILDIKVANKENMNVKTLFLQADTAFNLHITGNLFNPEVSGIIELMQGTFAFPYKPLYINNCKIYIMPNSPDNFIIDLTAKNRIKKYDITMTITGSLEQPKVTFDSFPSLQEEQIVTLLLSGTEESSLFLLMPNIIMQNLENLLFGSAENLSNLQQYFKNILKPLKNIRIVPVVDDQQSDKIVKGAIEFDINDRLRAKIQNNLNLSEDTQVEVEYSLSDDISIKALRDNKNNLGGEIEMRWKF